MSVFKNIYKQKNNESSRPSFGAPEPASGRPIFGGIATGRDAAGKPITATSGSSFSGAVSGRPSLGVPESASGRPSLGAPGQSIVSLFSLLDQSDKDFLFEEGNEKLLAEALDTQVKSGRPSFGGMLTNTPTEEKAVKEFASDIGIAKGTAKGREFFQPRTQAGEIPDYIARLSQPSQTATLPTLMNLPTLPIGRQKLGTARQNPFKTAAKQDLLQSGVFQPSLPKLNLYGFERAPNMQPGTLQRIATAGQEMIKSGQALNPTILKATSV